MCCVHVLEARGVAGPGSAMHMRVEEATGVAGPGSAMHMRVEEATRNTKTCMQREAKVEDKVRNGKRLGAWRARKGAGGWGGEGGSQGARTGSTACARSQLELPLNLCPLAFIPFAGFRLFGSMAENCGV